MLDLCLCLCYTIVTYGKPTEDLNTMSTHRRAAFNVLLSDEEFKQLEELAQIEGRARGAMLRQLIKRAYNMTVQAIPTCADGAACALNPQRPIPQQFRRI